MAVEVKIPTVLQKLTGGTKSVQVEGSTLREVVEALDRQFPGMRDQVADGSGELHRYVNVYLNDEDIRFLGKLDAPVSDGDVVQILPALAGGCGCMCSRASLA